jgi:hypothetical protein
MFKSYNLDDLILYSHCPLKYAYSKTDESDSISSDSDHRTIVLLSLKDAIINHFTLKGMGRVLSPENDSRFFSKKWHHYGSLLHNKQRNSAATNILVKAHERALNIANIFPKNYEIAAVNFPTELIIKSYPINSSVDLLFIDKNNTKNALIIILDTSLRKKAENDIGTYLRATFNLSATTKDLIDKRVNVKCITYNLLYDYKKEVVLNRDHRIFYPKILTNIIKCIEHESFYPRASTDACQYCPYKQICSWKIK